MTNDLARERLTLTLAFSIGFGVVVLIVAPIGGALAFVWLGWAFPVITLLGLLSGGLLIAFAWLSAIQDVRWALVESIASELDDASAQREAVRSASIIQNINAPGGTVKARPIVYKVGGQLVNGNQLNQIAQTEPRRIEIAAADVRWFAEQLANGYPLSKAKWLGLELPYSRLPVSWAIYKALIDPLASYGAIAGRGERASGKLVEKNPAQLVKVIEQAHPGASTRGIVLELPESTGN